jgi:two-component system sensor histidine kinase/response regulator
LQQWAVLQKNKISVSPVQIQLWELVESTFTLLESPARNKNIRLANQISRELQAFADEKMMDVVFRNILSNAVKFSNSGGQIVVSSFCANGHTTISIKDFGVGIPEAILQNLFSIKGADSQPGTAGEKGTGLGLLISKEFVELNGGKIWATSQPGNGSEFCVELPVKE